jgi:diguanylate cyclase (GGDEF)-like protein
MHVRLLPITRIGGVVGLLMALSIVPWTNPLALAPLLVTSALMGWAATTARARGDVRGILGAVVLLQIAITGAILINGRVGVGDLFLLVTAVVPASGGFPGRVVTAIALLSGSLMVLAGLVSGAALASPPILLLPLFTLASVTLLATAVRRASIDHRRAALVDGLTGAQNRAALGMRSEELDRAGEGMTVLIADVDHFKQVNDLYGHQTGDAVLVELAALLAERGEVFRMGGDEFVLLFGGRSAAEVRPIADALAAAVRAAPLAGVPVSVSVGVAGTGDVDGAGFAQAFAAADTALYRAKHAGRDAVRVASAQLTLA